MTTIGLIEPISAYTGIGTGRRAARSNSALPPANEPVKPTAAISGASTSASPTSTPAAGRFANVPSGRPASATAARSSRATSSPVPGCDGWPLTITGQPAASADAVSPPAVENASGKLEAPNTATGPSGTRMRRTSGFGIGFASGSGWSMIASASSPASTIAANASSWPQVRSSSERRRGVSGRPVSASHTATISSPAARRRAAAPRSSAARLARSRSAPDRWTAAAASTAARTSCGDASS